MFGLTALELSVLRPLTTPAKVQDFLDTLPMNHEKRAETCASPRRVLRERRAHCLEGALLAAAAFWLSGSRPLLLELRATAEDQDHALALYTRGGYWGAVSKTNHATVRFRDPVYKTVRELALSYFHEYFLDSTGEKTLRSYTRPFNLRKFGTGWMTQEDDLWDIAYALHDAPHFPILTDATRRHIRTADAMERKAGSIIEWPLSDPRT